MADRTFHEKVRNGDVDFDAAFEAADAKPPPKQAAAPPATAPPPAPLSQAPAPPAGPALGRGRGVSTPSWMKDPTLAERRH